MSQPLYQHRRAPTETQGAVRVRVRVKVQNTSQRAGDEVAPLYRGNGVSSVVTPAKQLKKFRRLALQAGERPEVAFELTAEDLRLLNGSLQWGVEPGTFTLLQGAPAEDSRLQAQFNLTQGAENIGRQRGIRPPPAGFETG